MPWLLEMLKSDVFGGAERISRDHFMTIRGDSPDKNAFWRVVSQIAMEKFNMQEVFNMKSTVRLTAIEKLCELLLLGCGTIIYISRLPLAVPILLVGFHCCSLY